MFPPIAWSARREVNRWLKSHRARLLRLAWIWSGDPVLAEDLVQETYIRALKSAKTLRDADRADAWVIRIMHHVYLDYLKSAKRREGPMETDRLDHVAAATGWYTGVENEPETRAIEHQRSARVRHAVASLPDGQREVVTLVDLEELTYAECAHILDVPVGTVMSRLNRARATLRQRLLDAAPGAHLRRVK
jgi:RNA polymerase sigma-70 factor, ECF subfamily